MPRQYTETTRIIESNNFELVKNFEIIDVSGASVHDSPEFKELLKLVENREIDVLVASEMSRICRPDSMDKFAVLDALTRTGCLLNVGGQEVDLRSPEGFLTGGLHALFAGHERLMLQRKMWASKEENRKRGWLASSKSTLPKGVDYSKDTRTWFYDDDIHLIVEAFRRVDEDGVRNLSELARFLGIGSTGVRHILTNEIYTGWRVYDQKSDLSVKRTKPGARQGYRPMIARAPDEIIRVKVIDEPAVTRERFDRVQLALKEVRYSYLQNVDKVRKINLCTGIARCGYCAEPFYSSANGKRRHPTGKSLGYYVCKSLHPVQGRKLTRCSNVWVRIPNIDELMMAFCRDILLNHEVLFPLIAGSVKRTSEVIRPFPTQAPESAIAKLERKDKRLIEMCGEGAIDIAELKNRRAVIRLEIERLREIGQRHSSEDSGEFSMEGFVKQLVAGILRFTSAMEGSIFERKQMLQQIFAAVFFCEESITAFQLRETFVAGLVGDVDWLRSVITLEVPFRIREHETLPRTHKKCRKCHQSRPKGDFYTRRAICNTCYLENKKARRRRKALEEKDKAPD